jgi:hypothetical protein
MTNPSHVRSESRRIEVYAGPRQKLETLYKKTSKGKRARGMASMRALNSNPSIGLRVWLKW